MGETGIRKAGKRKTNFVQVSNALAQDSTICFATRGMLLYLLSKPDDWAGRPRDIEREGAISYAKRRKMIKAAEKAGYIAYRKTKCQKTGQFDCWYEVYDEPIPAWERTKSWESGLRKTEQSHPPCFGGVDSLEPPPMFPLGGNPLSGEPLSGEGGGHNKKDLSNKDLPKKEAEESTASASDGRVNEIKERLGVPLEHAEFMLEMRPDSPPSLVTAALDCWLEPSGAKRRWETGNPMEFIRGVLGHPGAFGVKEVGGVFRYQTKTMNRATLSPSRERALIEQAKQRILQMRRSGAYGEDDQLVGYLHPIPSDCIKRAFQELASA